MNFPFSRPFTLDSTVRLFLFIIVAAIIVITFRYLSPVLLPFFFAWLLAYLIYPMVAFVQYKLKFKNRNISVITVLLCIFSTIGVLLWLLIPTLISELLKLKDFIIQYAQTGSGELIPQKWEIFLHNFITKYNIAGILEKENFNDVIKEIFPHAWSILTSSLSITISIFAAFIVILYLYFILKDYHKIARNFIALIPKKYRSFFAELMHDMERGMNNYYRGQSLVALIVGVLFCIGFSIINMPLGILMGIILGFLNIIPYLQVIGIPPCILLMLVHAAETNSSAWGHLLALFIVFVAIQLFQDGYLVPKIMGKQMGLNAAIILLSLSIFGMILGVLGVIIALPTTTLIISYYKKYILLKLDNSQKHKKHL